MLIAQMSDLHFLPRGMLAFGKVDTADCLERGIAHLNALDPAPDVVLITGDLTSDGDDYGVRRARGDAGRARGALLSAARQP